MSDLICREHLIEEIELLMKSPWFNSGKEHKEALVDIENQRYFARKEAIEIVRDLCVKQEPSVAQEARIGYCKDCKHFEYDSMANIDGIPLIVAHEICNKWGDGCKTKENGYCFLFEKTTLV